MILRLEERIEVPEDALDDIPGELRETHLKKQVANFIEDLPIWMGFSRIYPAWRGSKAVAAECFIPPGSGEDLLTGKRADFRAEIDSCFKEFLSIRGDQNDPPYFLMNGDEPPGFQLSTLPRIGNACDNLFECKLFRALRG